MEKSATQDNSFQSGKKGKREQEREETSHSRELIEKQRPARKGDKRPRKDIKDLINMETVSLLNVVMVTPSLSVDFHEQNHEYFSFFHINQQDSNQEESDATEESFTQDNISWSGKKQKRKREKGKEKASGSRKFIEGQKQASKGNKRPRDIMELLHTQTVSLLT